jgi:transposase InsO family protein
MKIWGDLHVDAGSVVNALCYALRSGPIHCEIYLDNKEQFASKFFKDGAQKLGIKLIFGWLYNPKGRGKIECYYKTLYQERIILEEFRSLNYIWRALWNSGHKYNNRQKQEILCWMMPASVCINKINFK